MDYSGTGGGDLMDGVWRAKGRDFSIEEFECAGEDVRVYRGSLRSLSWIHERLGGEEISID